MYYKSFKKFIVEEQTEVYKITGNASFNELNPKSCEERTSLVNFVVVKDEEVNDNNGNPRKINGKEVKSGDIIIPGATIADSQLFTEPEFEKLYHYNEKAKATNKAEKITTIHKYVVLDREVDVNIKGAVERLTTGMILVNINTEDEDENTPKFLSYRDESEFDKIYRIK